MESSEEIKVKKSTIWKVLTFVFAALFLISIFTDVFKLNNSKDNVVNDDNEIVGEKIVSVGDDSMLGNKDAKVAIIEFSDYQCPYCKRFHTEAFEQLKKDYIDTGRVSFVYRDFPLSFHQNAQKASESAECADEQGKFWEMHNAIFENQDNIAVSDLKKYAKDLGLDTNKFNDCMDLGRMEKEVKKDFADGSAAGVTGTPTFFINGKMLVGAQPYSAFKQIIDPLL